MGMKYVTDNPPSIVIKLQELVSGLEGNEYWCPIAGKLKGLLLTELLKKEGETNGNTK